MKRTLCLLVGCVAGLLAAPPAPASGSSPTHPTRETTPRDPIQPGEQAGTSKHPDADGRRFDPVLRDIEGWQVFVDPSLLPGGEHADEGQRALTMLANHLQRIKILMLP
ncbi:MAG: hypothetical protein D6766_03680, partial [Verrucomicrobia bacterium]